MIKSENRDMWLYERELFSDYTAICGVDEAGRGCLCGPVCAAAVILPGELMLDGVDDSKKLTEKKREKAFSLITENAVAYSYAFASPEEIDEINILNASFLAMKRAIEKLSVKADFALIDGNRFCGTDIPHRCIVGGDSKSLSIAAASIIAKVTRDRLMYEYAKKYPGYGYETNKGYPTEQHYSLLKENGITDIYRKTFLKKTH